MFDLKITVNGIDYEKQINPDMRLLDFIRNDLGLTGTKEGCGEGECGACTVIVDGKAVDSCLMLAAQCHGKKIETIEGVGKGGELHPVQQSFLDNGAVQCGFCIPGMVLSAKALLDSKPDASEDDIKECVSGNLCRCTGYDKMFKAVKDAQKVYRKEMKNNG
ncbi:purine hydroxlyse, delta subunit [Gottschalkia acidurici 9a]|uniref:Purine hydroxlyse, delta subunit n=1 Tax=Gottschalkia acidurici (strain ATCC 7906 / DSM 604 / BCRC 14475 / CIP 104303 / KCTC 5404 / NCIMB 10678 / 9a) TaxID=1128398 RepID=K0B1J6_GOTA9|nr:(2Fe-2S)-binding protein [Gottschalkia acidurici]AFS78947.1 purine hydroxlyse, delta subunit [Gottschalkia acidurici 9a]